MSDYNITLEELKKFLNVRHSRDDDLIESRIKMALEDVQNAIDRRFDDPTTWGSLVLVDADGNIPAPLRGAVEMVVDDLYRNRSTQFDKSQFDNTTFTRLFEKYRRMGV